MVFNLEVCLSLFIFYFFEVKSVGLETVLHCCRDWPMSDAETDFNVIPRKKFLP